MKQSKTKRLIEAALMVALATVLSIVKFIDLPAGGSVTLASMLPIIILSYRQGIVAGLGGGLVYAVLQQLLGISTLSYVTTPLSVVTVIFLDYILAFTFAGLGGIFRKIVKKQNKAILLGALLASAIRFICHFISGITVWAGLSIPDYATVVYSLGYNATYMIPETIILCAVGYYLCSVVDFSREVPTRAVFSRDEGESKIPNLLGGLFAVAGVVADVFLIAPCLQDESGAFSFAGIAECDWLAVGIVSAVALLGAVGSFVYAKIKRNDAHPHA